MKEIPKIIKEKASYSTKINLDVEYKTIETREMKLAVFALNQLAINPRFLIEDPKKIAIQILDVAQCLYEEGEKRGWLLDATNVPLEAK